MTWIAGRVRNRIPEGNDGSLGCCCCVSSQACPMHVWQSHSRRCSCAPRRVANSRSEVDSRSSRAPGGGSTTVRQGMFCSTCRLTRPKFQGHPSAWVAWCRREISGEACAACPGGGGVVDGSRSPSSGASSSSVQCSSSRRGITSVVVESSPVVLLLLCRFGDGDCASPSGVPEAVGGDGVRSRGSPPCFRV